MEGMIFTDDQSSVRFMGVGIMKKLVEGFEGQVEELRFDSVGNGTFESRVKVLGVR